MKYLHPANQLAARVADKPEHGSARIAHRRIQEARNRHDGYAVVSEFIAHDEHMRGHQYSHAEENTLRRWYVEQSDAYERSGKSVHANDMHRDLAAHYDAQGVARAAVAAGETINIHVK